MPYFHLYPYFANHLSCDPFFPNTNHANHTNEIGSFVTVVSRGNGSVPMVKKSQPLTVLVRANCLSHFVFEYFSFINFRTNYFCAINFRAFLILIFLIFFRTFNFRALEYAKIDLFCTSTARKLIEPRYPLCVL